MSELQQALQSMMNSHVFRLDSMELNSLSSTTDAGRIVLYTLQTLTLTHGF